MDQSPPNELKPRKIARQERSEATVEALVEAAARILQRDGAAGLTTNRIAELAGVSIGSLYQYFPNKDAIVVALIEAQLKRDHEFTEHLADGAGDELEAKLRRATAQICEHQYRLAPLLAQLLPLLSPLGQEQLVSDYLDRMCGAFDALLVPHKAQLRTELHDDEMRRVTVRVLADALRGALNSAVARDPAQLLDESFRDVAYRLARGALL